MQVNQYIVKRVHHSKTIVRITQVFSDHAVGTNLRTGKQVKVKLTDKFFPVKKSNLQFAKNYCQIA